jgi:YVTN family beta-propeller protein
VSTQRTYPILVAFIASSSLLLGNNWKAVATCGNGTLPSHIDTIILPSETVEGILLANDAPSSVAITPDATKALVTTIGHNGDSDFVLVYDLTQPLTTLLGSPIELPTGSLPSSIAISPDGTIAAVVNNGNTNVSLIDVVQRQILGSPISVGTDPREVAITTDGTKALVTNYGSGTISVIDLGSTSVSATITVGTSPLGIAVTPDGTKALVGDGVASSVYIINLSSLSPTATITLSHSTNGVAISPDGTLALVSHTSAGTVTAINLANLSIIGSPIIVGTTPDGISFTPDGEEAFVADPSDNTIYVLDLTQLSVLTNGNSFIIPTSTVDSAPTRIAITPDQAPTARFVFSVHGTTVFFDGSASTSPVGGIRSYIWDFGDGSTQTTSVPTVSHTYSRKRPFTASLTVVSDGGTSLDVVFTGQTVSNNGGPSAKSIQTVAGPARPTAFVGKAHLHHNKRCVRLKTNWHKSTARHVKKYQIFAHKKKIATIRAKHKLTKTITLHPHRIPKHISEKYRLYLHDKYSVRTVDASGNTSFFTTLHVRH